MDDDFLNNIMEIKDGLPGTDLEDKSAQRIYLSDVINEKQFKTGQANIIIAPCHSGKTTAAINRIAKLAGHPEKVIFLIDTSAGKEAMINQDGTAKYSRQWFEDIKIDEWWGALPSGEGVRVMTYHQFGYKLLENSHFLENIKVIICDEMHNLIKYMNIESAKEKHLKQNPCKTALEELARVSNLPEAPLVVIMTATANPVFVALDKRNVNVEYFDYSDKVTCDKTKHTVYYSNVGTVLAGLSENERAIIYVQSVTQMKKIAEAIDDGRRNICCLWSINNEDHPMGEEQMAVRDEILAHKQIPEHIDILLLNAAYETSLNIENEDFQTMIIHSGCADARIQVRGRIRHDIETMYLYDPDHEHIADYFPEEYYGRFLDSSDTASIVGIMDLKDGKGKQRKWPSIVKSLQSDGIIAEQVKQNGRRGWILRKPA